MIPIVSMCAKREKSNGDHYRRETEEGVDADDNQTHRHEWNDTANAGCWNHQTAGR